CARQGPHHVAQNFRYTACLPYSAPRSIDLSSIVRTTSAGADVPTRPWPAASARSWPVCATATADVKRSATSPASKSVRRRLISLLHVQRREGLAVRNDHDCDRARRLGRARVLIDDVMRSRRLEETFARFHDLDGLAFDAQPHGALRDVHVDRARM